MIVVSAQMGAGSAGLTLGTSHRGGWRRLRAACLLGSALTASLALSGVVHAQAFNAIPSQQAGNVTFNRLSPMGPGTETVTVNTPSATIVWNPNGPPTNPYIFLPQGNVALYQGAPGNGNFSILNRLLNISAPIQFDGTIITRISNSNLSAGGTVAFSAANNNDMIFSSSFIFDGNRLRLQKDETNNAGPDPAVTWNGTFLTRAGLGGLYLDNVTFFATAGTITKSLDASFTFLDLKNSFFSLGGATFGLDSVLMSNSTFAFNSSSSAPSRTLFQNFTLSDVYGSFFVGANRTLTLAGNIGDDGTATAFVKDDEGTLVLNGNNSYLGVTYVFNGTLRVVGNDAMTDSRALDLSYAPARAEIDGNATVGALHGAAGTSLNLISGIFSAGSVNTSTTFAGDLSGAGSFLKYGTGTLTLSGNNDAHSGLFYVVDGTAIAQGGHALGDQSIVNVRLGSSLSISGSETIGALTGAGNVTFSLANLTIGGANTSTSFSGNINGIFGSLIKIGTGTQTLSGTTFYTGLTVQGGTLRVEAGVESGGSSGGPTVVASGGTVEFGSSSSQTGDFFLNGLGNGGVGAMRNAAGSTTVNGAIQLQSDSSITSEFAALLTLNGNVTGNGNDLTLGGPGLMIVNGNLSGLTSLTKDGTGTINLAGNNTYTGPTIVNAGILNLASGTAIANTGALIINAGGTVAVTASEGVGSLAGAGNLSLTSNGVRFSVGAANTSTTFSGVLAGVAGSVVDKIGAGTLTLSGSNTAGANFLGTLNLFAGGSLGSLVIDGNIGDVVSRTAQLNINSGVLGGSGTFFGNVSVGTAALAPGNSPGTLTIAGNLGLTAGTILVYELGEAGAVGGPNNDLVIVGGNLTLDGTLRTVASGAGYGPGYYRLFNYGGALTDNGLNIGTIAGGYSATVLTNIAGQVNLLLGTQNVLYWDGTDTTGASNAATGNGGAGVWNAASTNWTVPTGYAINTNWNSQVGVFAGAAGGTVTVQGTQTFQELRFATNGYNLAPADGSARLSTTGGFSIIDVAAGVTASIGTTIQGAGGLTKTGAGTLGVADLNTYTGLTSIAGGVLVGTATSFSGNIANNAALIFNQGTGGTYAGVISGTGSVTKAGAGNLTLTGTNTYTGGTTILAGALFGDTSSLQGNILNNAALAFNQAAGGTYAGVISGTGSVLKLGAGNLTLTGANTYSGGTTISAGVVFGTTTSLQGNFASSGGLVFNQATNGTFAGAISGTGVVAKNGTGTVTFSGVNTYTGRTSILAGELAVTGGAALSDVGEVSIAGGQLRVATSETIGSLDGVAGTFVNLANATLTLGGNNASTTFAGSFNGTGGLIKTGTGTFTLTSYSGFTGTTTVNAGVLVLTASGGILGGPLVNNARFRTRARWAGA